MCLKVSQLGGDSVDGNGGKRKEKEERGKRKEERGKGTPLDQLRAKKKKKRNLQNSGIGRQIAGHYQRKEKRKGVTN